MILFWFQNDSSDNCEIEHSINHIRGKIFFPNCDLVWSSFMEKNSTTGARYRDTNNFPFEVLIKMLNFHHLFRLSSFRIDWDSFKISLTVQTHQNSVRSETDLWSAMTMTMILASGVMFCVRINICQLPPTPFQTFSNQCLHSRGSIIMRAYKGRTNTETY